MRFLSFLLPVAIPLAVAILIKYGAIARNFLRCEVCFVQTDAICAVISQEICDNRGVALGGIYHLLHALDVLCAPARVVRWVAATLTRCAHV